MFDYFHLAVVQKRSKCYSLAMQCSAAPFPFSKFWICLFCFHCCFMLKRFPYLPSSSLINVCAVVCSLLGIWPKLTLTLTVVSPPAAGQLVSCYSPLLIQAYTYRNILTCYLGKKFISQIKVILWNTTWRPLWQITFSHLK